MEQSALQPVITRERAARHLAGLTPATRAAGAKADKGGAGGDLTTRSVIGGQEGWAARENVEQLEDLKAKLCAGGREMVASKVKAVPGVGRAEWSREELKASCSWV